MTPNSSRACCRCCCSTCSPSGSPTATRSAQRLQAAGFADVLEGTVYPALARLEREGRLATRLVPSPSGPARKYYRLTPAGRDALAAARQAWSRHVAGVEAVSGSSRCPRLVDRRKTLTMPHKLTAARPDPHRTPGLDARPAPLRPAAPTRASPSAARCAPTCSKPPPITAPARRCAASGSSGSLAREYLGAEFGDRPRHSWIAAAYFAALVPLLLNFVLSGGRQRLRAGSRRRAHRPGTYTWSGVSYLQSPLTFTVDQGQVDHSGGAWTPIVYVIWLAGTIACGRLWRLLPSSSRGQHTPAAEY